jgi:hypothetical protein
MTTLAEYNRVATAESFASRASRGTMSLVRELDDGIVEKSDRPDDVPLVAREFIITDHLVTSGVVPRVDVNEGLYGYPVSFQMEKINNGGTLQDWLQAHAEQAMDRDLWDQLLTRLQRNIRQVWEHGVIHGDLHVRNVVIGLDQAGKQLEPIVIDFGVSQLNEDTLLALAHGYGLRDEVADSQGWFKRQVAERYDDPADERDFLVADLQSWMTRLNISDLDCQLADFRRGLRP